MTQDEDAMTQGGGAKCHTNLDQTTKDGTEMTDQHDQGSKMALVSVNRDTA